MLLAVFAAAALLVWFSLRGHAAPPDALPSSHGTGRSVVDAQVDAQHDAPPGSRDPSGDPTQRDPATSVRERAYRGTVTGWRSLPLADAAVVLSSSAGEVARTTTDERGAFSVPWSPGMPDELAVAASAPHHATGRVAGSVGAPVRLVLDAEVEVRGTVRDRATGAPIEGVAVRAGSAQARTDAAGRYVLPAPIRHGLRVEAHSIAHAHEQVSLTLHRLAAVTVDFELAPFDRIVARVVDSVSGAPIAGVRITGAPRRRVRSTSDTAGRFELLAAPGEPVEVELSAHGYLDVTWICTFGQNGPGQNGRGQNGAAVDLRVPMVRPAVVSGVVRDETGEAMRRVRIRRWESGYPRPRTDIWADLRARFSLPGRLQRTSRDVTAETDANGRFRLEIEPLDEPFTLLAMANGRAPAASRELLLREPGETQVADFELQRGAVVVGSARCNGVAWLGIVRWLGDAPGVSGTTSTTELGQFALHGVPPGRLTLELRDGRTERLRHRRTVDVVAGAANELQIEWQEKVGEVRGKVVTVDGRPLEGQIVQALVHDGEQDVADTAYTDAQGRYTLPVNGVARVDVRLLRAGRATWRRRVPTDGSDGDVDFVVPELGLLRLQLVDAATGEPVRPPSARGLTSWRAPGDVDFHELHGALDGIGRFEAELPVGRVDVCLQLGAAGYQRQVVVGLTVGAEPQPEAVRVELVRGATASLRIDDAAGFRRQMANAVTVLLREDELGVVEVATRADRAGDPDRLLWQHRPDLAQRVVWPEQDLPVLLHGLSTGRYRLVAIPDVATFEPAWIDVGGAANEPVDVRWRPR